MVMDKYPIARSKFLYTPSNFHDFPGRLMPKYDWCFLFHIPAHDITRTNSTYTSFDQRFPGAKGWQWFLLKPNIRRIVETRYFGTRHTQIKLLPETPNLS